MTARGMASDDDGTRNKARRDFNSARDLLGHRAYPGFGRERIGWDGAGPSARDRARREMRPHFAIEPQPVTAMDEHQKTLRGGFGQKKVEPVTLFWTIRDGGPSSLAQGRAKSGSFPNPTRRKCFGAGDEGPVRIGAVVIHSGVSGLQSQFTAL